MLWISGLGVKGALRPGPGPTAQIAMRLELHHNVPFSRILKCRGTQTDLSPDLFCVSLHPNPRQRESEFGAWRWHSWSRVGSRGLQWTLQCLLAGGTDTDEGVAGRQGWSQDPARLPLALFLP